MSPIARSRGNHSIIHVIGLQTAQVGNHFRLDEYRIILTLLERTGSVVSRETLMEKLWATDSFVDENTLTVNVARLRKRLGAIGLSDFIETRKGLGYMIK